MAPTAERIELKTNREFQEGDVLIHNPEDKSLSGKFYVILQPNVIMLPETEKDPIRVLGGIMKIQEYSIPGGFNGEEIFISKKDDCWLEVLPLEKRVFLPFIKVY